MHSISMPDEPDVLLSVRELFGIDSAMQVKGFSERSDYVPGIDDAYHFNPEVTLAILAGFTHNRRVMLQGLHGTGKSTPHRANRRTPQLALYARQSRWPYQPPGSGW